MFSVRSPVIHRALLVEPVIGIPQINHPPIRGVEVVNIVADTRRRILLARQALRAHLIGIQNHIFNPPNPRNRLSIRNPFRQFLGSLQLTNWNWGGGDQCNSEEFIRKLLDLLPVREEEKLVIFKRQGYAATDQELTLPHTDLEARQVQMYGAVNMQLQENHNTVFSDTFKYGQKDISRNSGGSIVMTITRHMLIHAQENVRRFGRRESGISLLSELLFEKLTPNVKDFLDNYSHLHRHWKHFQVVQGVISGRMYLKDRALLNSPKNKIGEPTNVLLKAKCFDNVGSRMS